MIKKYGCPECKGRFKTIRDVNQHISKTGCNNKTKVSIGDYFSINQIQEIVLSSVKYLVTK